MSRTLIIKLPLRYTGVTNIFPPKSQEGNILHRIVCFAMYYLATLHVNYELNIFDCLYV